MLDNYRKNIDIIDKEIVILLKKRFSEVEKVGKYKLDNDLPVLDTSREQEKFDSLSIYISDKTLENYIKNIFKSIMDESKAFQNTYIFSKKDIDLKKR